MSPAPGPATRPVPRAFRPRLEFLPFSLPWIGEAEVDAIVDITDSTLTAVLRDVRGAA